MSHYKCTAAVTVGGIYSVVLTQGSKKLIRHTWHRVTLTIVFITNVDDTEVPTPKYKEDATPKVKRILQRPRRTCCWVISCTRFRDVHGQHNLQSAKRQFSSYVFHIKKCILKKKGSRT